MVTVACAEPSVTDDPQADGMSDVSASDLDETAVASDVPADTLAVSPDVLMNVDGAVAVDVSVGEDVAVPVDRVVAADVTTMVDRAVPADVSTSLVRVTFTATTADFPNPERGFYRTDDEFATLTDAGLRTIASAGRRLTFAYARLDAYRSADLPASYLTSVDAAFARVRRAGLKVILRFAYNRPQNETEYRNAQDATLSRVQGHLRQLAPVLERNADVLAVLQAGFIGAWGEWHTSSNMLATASNRTAVRDAILAALPRDRFVQFRNPPYIMAWYPTLPSLDAVIAGRAPQVGFHNDCFLASASDVGTYDPASQIAAQRAYARALSAHGPFGGETCNPADDPGARPRMTCTDIRREGAEYHLAYLNEEYFDGFINRWRTEGCLAEVTRTMGYRFAFQSLEHPADGVVGGAMDVVLSVVNNGWARLFNARPVVLIAIAAGTTRAVPLPLVGIDPRRWVPGATEHRASARVALPAAMTAGRYELCVALPDAAASIAADVRYAIHPANGDDTTRGQRWDATLGCFRTGTSITVR
jgi:hypothetical protein